MTENPFKQAEFEQEKTQKEWENMIEVKIDPKGESLQSLINYLKEPSSIEPEKCIRFLMTPDFDIFLSHQVHRVIAVRLEIDIGDCLIPDGQILAAPAEKKFYFRYTWGNTREHIQRNKNLYAAAENKITELLKSHGIKFTEEFKLRR